MLSVKTPQKRHPERSASQIYRVTQRLMARSRRACPERSRRNPEGAYFTHAALGFSTTEAALGRPATVFPWGRDKECWHLAMAGGSIYLLSSHLAQALHWRHPQPVSARHAT